MGGEEKTVEVSQRQFTPGQAKFINNNNALQAAEVQLEGLMDLILGLLPADSVGQG